MKTEKNARKNYCGTHILSESIATETDTRVTGINNNVLVIGPPGSGKTRHYIRPNLYNAENESVIISDTKGSLYGELAPVLERRGYIVRHIDFTDTSSGDGYDPFDYIRRDLETGCCLEQDVMTLSHSIIREMSKKDPFWDHAARQYLECLIAYALDMLPEGGRSLEHIQRLLDEMNGDDFAELVHETEIIMPESVASARYRAIKGNAVAEKMDASIRGVLSTQLNGLTSKAAAKLYHKKKRIDIAGIGKEKTAVFLTISDTDRSFDSLAGIFMTQALQILCRSADHDSPEHCLPVPVRFYLDDFATNLYIPDFDKIISVVRSREIYVSVILQSLTQLDSLYGESCARTIINNCDQQIYLGGQDIETAGYISERVNRTVNSVLNMPIDKMYVFIRGRAPEESAKYNC